MTRQPMERNDTIFRIISAMDNQECQMMPKNILDIWMTRLWIHRSVERSDVLKSMVECDVLSATCDRCESPIGIA